MKRILVLVLLLLPIKSLAWHDAGHKIIAAMAYYDLGAVRAKKVADILRMHPDYALWMREKPAELSEDLYLFTRAAVWPDDIRSSSHPSSSEHRGTWHYAAAWLKLGPESPEPALEAGLHIDGAMEQIGKTISGQASGREKAIALCWLFHLVGDIQMPLHAGSLVNRQYPQGDRGGNEFWVRFEGQGIRLHTFWDGLFNRDAAIAGSATKRLDQFRPADVDPAKVKSVAQALRNGYRRSQLTELKAKPFDINIKESREAARKFAYLDGTLLGATSSSKSIDVPSDYHAKCLATAKRRAALGGYRLADWLRRLMKM